MTLRKALALLDLAPVREVPSVLCPKLSEKLAVALLRAFVSYRRSQHARLALDGQVDTFLARQIRRLHKDCE